MIQRNSILNVVDNSGAKELYCIKVLNGYKKRYGVSGDLIIGSIKSIRLKKKKLLKIKKGDVVTGLVIRCCFNLFNYSEEKISFFENACIILTNKNKLMGTRVFGSSPRFLRYSKYSRILSICSGFI
jgi:large subunit ribosomal protein L14